ncbi:MAG: EamA family transporter [Bryobacterales bacterium]|nr:EamA family transporter [Bryobacterales bacterium]
MKWLLVATIVGATTCGELLQTYGMKRHGEIHDFRPGPLGRAFGRVARNPFVAASVLFMAVSFFAFLALLKVADLSFAVPATAATYVLETVLARFLLKERVGRRRWAGALLVACGVPLIAL